MNRDKSLESPNDEHNQHEESGGPDEGQSDAPETLPTTCAVYGGDFIQLRRYSLKRCQENNHIPADAFPDSQRHDGDPCSTSIAEPGNIVGQYAQRIHQQVIHQACPIRIEDILEKQ